MLNAHKDMEHYGVTENVNGQMKMMGASESGLAQTWMIFLSGKNGEEGGGGGGGEERREREEEEKREKRREDSRLRICV